MTHLVIDCSSAADKKLASSRCADTLACTECVAVLSSKCHNPAHVCCTSRGGSRGGLEQALPICLSVEGFVLWKAVSTLRIVSCACASNGKRLRRGPLLREVRRLRSGGRHRDRLAGRQHILRPGALVVGPRARGGILFGRGGSPRGHRCRRRERGVGAPRVAGTLTVLAGAISHILVVTVGFDEGSTLLLAGRPAPTRASGCPPGALLSFASVMPSTLSANGASDVLMLRGNCTGPPRRPSTPFTAMCP